MPKTTLERPKSNKETRVGVSGGDGDECGWRREREGGGEGEVTSRLDGDEGGEMQK